MLAQWLVEEMGAQVDARDALGHTPICYAVQSDNLEVFKFLEEKMEQKKIVIWR